MFDFLGSVVDLLKQRWSGAERNGRDRRRRGPRIRLPGKFSEHSCRRGRSPFFYRDIDNAGDWSTLRTWYMHDLDAIIYSPHFRKLQKKIQLLPMESRRLRTRLVHTLEVARISTQLAMAMGADANLVEAMAYGHDLGNTAHGRGGNEVLRKLGDYRHEDGSAEMLLSLSSRRAPEEIAQRIAAGQSRLPVNGGPGSIAIALVGGDPTEYPISEEVLDGVRMHGVGSTLETANWSTIEAQILRIADEFAYLIQDIDDAFEVGVLSQREYQGHRWNEEVFGHRWADLDVSKDTLYEQQSLKNLFQENRGHRLAAMVHRTVLYNNWRLENEVNKSDGTGCVYSSLLEKNIPRILIDPQLRILIDELWNSVIGPKVHTAELVSQTYEHAQKVTTELFNALEISGKDRLASFRSFMARHRQVRRFDIRSDKWLASYFIAHLTVDQVEGLLAFLTGSGSLDPTQDETWAGKTI